MPAPDTGRTAAQSTRFLYLYALAVAGGAVAYIPFLTILLPNQATAIWGEDALTVLAQAAFAGALGASIANILFGWVSDRSGTRRPWILLGLILSSALLPTMHLATNPEFLIIMILCWQFSLNLMLAPLAAWAGDTVPDTQKGLLGGLLSFAPALGALSGIVVTLPSFPAQTDRLVIVASLVVAMVSPVLFAGRPVPMPHLAHEPITAKLNTEKRRKISSATLRMWLARLCVQIAEAALFAFLLLWFRSVAPGFTDNNAATIFAMVLGVSVFATLAIGRWSDHTNRPILPLAMCAAIAAIGLVIMAVAANLAWAISGYVVFCFASSIFLALHSSQTLRVLPSPKTRGRDLGFFNLTNTVPSLIMPWLTLALVPVYGFGALFAVLAALAIVAAILLVALARPVKH